MTYIKRKPMKDLKSYFNRYTYITSLIKLIPKLHPLQSNFKITILYFKQKILQLTGNLVMLLLCYTQSFSFE